MKINRRDIDIISKVDEYITEIKDTVNYFGDDYETFIKNNIYCNAISMCILQIGELSGLLSDQFKELYNEIPWRNIKGMRNIMAHKYGAIDKTIVWETIKIEIPNLEEFTRKIMNDNIGTR